MRWGHGGGGKCGCNGHCGMMAMARFYACCMWLCHGACEMHRDVGYCCMPWLTSLGENGEFGFCFAKVAFLYVYFGGINE